MLQNRDHWAETVHTDDREIASSALERVLAGEFVVQEYRIVRSDRTVRWIRDTLFPIRDQYGRVERVGGIAQDITIDSGSRVYIVNGEEDSRQSLSLLLQRAGYSVKVFVAGLEFTEVAPVLALGCVVLDTRPSSASGLALLKQVRLARRICAPGDGELRNAVNSQQSELRRKTSDVVGSDRLEFGAEQSHDELDRHAVAAQPPPRDRLDQALEIGLRDTFPASDAVAAVQPVPADDYQP